MLLSLEPVTRRSSSRLNAQDDTYREWPDIQKSERVNVNENCVIVNIILK